MDSPALDLEWDDQEAITVPSGRAWAKRSSKRGWLVITNSDQQRDTVVSSGPSTERSSHPTSAPIPLTSTLPRGLPSPVLSSPGLPSPNVFSPGLQAGFIAAEVAQLRRWLMVSLVLSALATVCAAIAVVVAMAPRNAPQHAGALLAQSESPLLSRPAAVPATVDVAAAPVAQKVKLTIALFSRATVTLTPMGGAPELLQGPWPRTLELDAGRYTLTASRRSRIFQRQLDLDADRPERQVTISLE